jgi:hypothetical protein
MKLALSSLLVGSAAAWSTLNMKAGEELSSNVFEGCETRVFGFESLGQNGCCLEDSFESFVFTSGQGRWAGSNFVPALPVISFRRSAPLQIHFRIVS